MPSRDASASAAETVGLVLGEDSPLPETDQDVADLVQRLRGHVMELTAIAPAGPAVDRALEISAADCPEDRLQSRVHLRELAMATQALMSIATTHQTRASVEPDLGPWRRWHPSRNVARGMVFALAMATLVYAGSAPRPW
ncbi:DUF6415 family natural product biosynthesis protein [Streptomyces sp. NPDC059835]|uniref:DUF6415 family natural product biosynthesis protein n=1 Tax=Streptomyces sp. NPDC059835 TaxID=3346967 RepID=UPI00364BD8BB